MSHVFQVPDDIYAEIAAYAAQRGQTPDALLMELVTERVKELKQEKSTTSIHKVMYDPTHDPLAPFIGAFDSGDDDPGWVERHDEYFVGNGDYKKRHDSNDGSTHDRSPFHTSQICPPSCTIAE